MTPQPNQLWNLGGQLIDIAGAPATRKRRSDAGQSRNGTQPTVEAVRERLQPSLSGLPDESTVGE